MELSRFLWTMKCGCSHGFGCIMPSAYINNIVECHPSLAVPRASPVRSRGGYHRAEERSWTKTRRCSAARLGRAVFGHATISPSNSWILVGLILLLQRYRRLQLNSFPMTDLHFALSTTLCTVKNHLNQSHLRRDSNRLQFLAVASLSIRARWSRRRVTKA